MEKAIASTAVAAGAAAPAAVQKKCDPVNVQVKEDGCCKLYYKVKGLQSASWDIVEREGNFYAVFETTVSGQGYYHESLAIPPDIRSRIDVETKGPKKDFYKVKITKTGSFKIASYFSTKM
ncbi:uncharacterized protein [Haliotis cracherodii]|uniref:uncharacterized protein n=1 Tax=Haliotis cracherodii TaxID=6455 RepID=UPI0039EBDABA